MGGQYQTYLEAAIFPILMFHNDEQNLIKVKVNSEYSMS